MMANIGDQIELGETAFILGALILIGYFIFKKGGGLDAFTSGAKDAVNTIANGATGTLTNSQISDIANQTAANVAQAGGSAADQASAAQQVTNYANWSKPLGGFLGIGGTDAFTEVPGTGQTIYSLRAAGYSDDAIQSMLDNANQQQVTVDDTSIAGSGGLVL